MKVNLCSYTKKEFIALLERDMADNDIVLMSTAVKGAETLSKLSLTRLTFEFPHEMIAKPDNILHLLKGSIVASTIIVRNPIQQVSKMYLDGLKENDGVFGFTLEQ